MKSPQWRQRLTEQWDDDVPRDQLCAEFGLTAWALDHWVRKLNLRKRPKHDGVWRAEFTRQWNEGRPVLDMARHFGVTRVTIHYWQQRFGLPRRGNGNQRRLDDEQMRQVVRMKAAKMSARAAARAMGVSHHTIMRYWTTARAVPRLPHRYACPRCGGKAGEVQGHSICTPLPMMMGIDRRESA